MSRLIDADALMKDLEKWMKEVDPTHPHEVPPMEDIIVSTLMTIEEQPTVEERKVGKWVRVPGYCTPGGDPVWACSECGKGEHVCGIEHGSYGAKIADNQWVSCPNCGGGMEGEK